MEKRTEDFLLAEYRTMAESFWRNEEAGERRVNFLITLVTAVIGAIIALVNQSDLTRETVYFAALFALLALLIFGIVTLMRLIRRNRVTDEYKHAMDLVRSFFRGQDERLQGYEPFPARSRRLPGTGGLVDTVSVVNSLVVMAIAILFGLLFRLIPAAIGIIGCATFLASEFCHYWFVKRQNES